ncbi:MAG: hypothetical protein O2992_15125 [Gemmatimonadetes bacterium]|jgi:hypothetical protein|nr:hypothetical protein [Gemmatimonadota bacterium]
MNPIKTWSLRGGLIITAFALFLPTAADAQRRGRQDEVKLPWPQILAGIHFGYDDKSNGAIIGVQARIPLLRNGRLEFAPNTDLTFVRGLREREYNLEAVVIPGGRRGGLYAGGGVAWRNSIFTSGPGGPRETIRGFSVLLGLKSGTVAEFFGSQIELRWVFLDGVPFDPQTITFGVNFPLTGRGRSASGS